MRSVKESRIRCGGVWGFALAAWCGVGVLAVPVAARAGITTDVVTQGDGVVRDDGMVRNAATPGAQRARTIFRHDGPIAVADGPWSENPIPTPHATPVARNPLIVYGDHIYSFGGAFHPVAGQNTRYVGRAPFLADGTIGPWQALTPLPMVLNMQCVAVHGDWVYVLGGYSDMPTNAVIRARIQADGTLGAWKGGLPFLPERDPWYFGWYGHGALVVGDVLYVYGGWRNASIYASTIDPAGNLGPWVHVGELPAQLYGFAQCVWEDRLYLIGGKEITPEDVQTVVATVRWMDLADWPHGTWHETNPMPAASWFHRVATYGPNLYVTGAYTDEVPPPADPMPVFHGGIHPDGSVEWNTTAVPPVPLGIFEPALVQYGGTLHCFGGFTTNAVHNLGLPPTNVTLDIKPGSCPNPINDRSQGVLPAALLGSPEIDVSTIDASSLELEGVGPIRSGVEDVGAPFDGAPCGCWPAGPDGFPDLTLKFRTQDLVAAIGALPRGDQPELTLSGALRDGTRFLARDCVVAVGNDHHEPDPAAPRLMVSKGRGTITQRVEFTVPAHSEVTLTVYDIAGRAVANPLRVTQAPGRHEVSWDASHLPSGVYFYRLQAGGVTATTRVLVLH